MVSNSILVAVAVVGLTAGNGCLLNKSDRDPNGRIQTILPQSNGLTDNDWGPRGFSTEHPTHIEPERIHGGII